MSDEGFGVKVCIEVCGQVHAETLYDVIHIEPKEQAVGFIMKDGAVWYQRDKIIYWRTFGGEYGPEN